VTLASEQLERMGLTLPPVPTPVAAYVPAVRFADLVFTSGQVPLVDGKLRATGLVGADVDPEEGYACARVAALNALAAAADAVGGVDMIARIVKMVVFVAAAPGFTGHPQVANGASNVLGEIFGPAGEHARSAVGVASLPLDAPVEVELVVAVGAQPTIHPR
jgi:enamine deaminase RidA (YjgF/YER057c/UK114 family)